MLLTPINKKQFVEVVVDEFSFNERYFDLNIYKKKKCASKIIYIF